MNSAARLLAGALAMTLGAASAQVLAQDDQKPLVRLVVGNPAGAGTDLIARSFVPRIAEHMNAVVIVDNKIGANGVIGTDFVAKATPNGRTMKINTLSEVLATALDQKLPYDLLRDLGPVLRLGWGECYVMIHESVPAKNVTEFVAWLKANPGKATYGSAGIGNITHLGAELFLQANGAKAAHAPYKGGSFMMVDFLAGRTQFVVAAASLALPVAKDHRVKILANTGVRRSPQLPDVPLLSDTNPGLSVANFWGVLVPSKTPAATVKNLRDMFVKIIDYDDVKGVILKQGVDISLSTTQEYGAQLKSDVARWTKVIKTAGIKPE